MSYEDLIFSRGRTSFGCKMIWQLSILFAFAPLALSCTGAGTIDLDSSMTQFTLQSDNYPDPYPDSNDCEWNFTSPADTQVTLSCSDVDIRGECEENRFAFIIEGEEERFCSGSLEVASSNNEMTVMFQTIRNNPRSTGFSCVVSFSPQGEPETGEEFATRSCGCSCGRRNSGSSRIVGGEQTSPHEYPWQAIINRYGRFICGGSLISNEWVVTAAHCINSGTASNYLVILGNHDRLSIENGEKFILVSEIIVHENYNSNRLYNDIGLLRLTSPVVYSATISPVCLPFRYRTDLTAFDGETTTVTGYGRLGTTAPIPRYLMEVDLGVLSYSECRSRYSGVTRSMLCATDIGKGVCFGDSGGPLVYQENDTDFLAGVVSFVVGGCANPRYFSGFTRVTCYLTWLQQNTGVNFEVC